MGIAKGSGPIVVGNRVLVTNKDSECWWIRHENVTMLFNMLFMSFFGTVFMHYITAHRQEAFEWKDYNGE